MTSGTVRTLFQNRVELSQKFQTFSNFYGKTGLFQTFLCFSNFHQKIWFFQVFTIKDLLFWTFPNFQSIFEFILNFFEVFKLFPNIIWYYIRNKSGKVQKSLKAFLNFLIYVFIYKLSSISNFCSKVEKFDLKKLRIFQSFFYFFKLSYAWTFILF